MVSKTANLLIYFILLGAKPCSSLFATNEEVASSVLSTKSVLVPLNETRASVTINCYFQKLTK